MHSIKLNSGYSIPILGLGTWLMTGRECYEAVTTALECGYTLFDTASSYNNEIDIGKAINDSDVDRSTLFLSTKVWYQKLKYRDVIDQCKHSLENLRTEYLDLLLIHWPNKFIPVRQTLEAFEQLIDIRYVRSIGVANFTQRHIEEAMHSTSLPIAVNQVETHPFLFQTDLISWCRNKNIMTMAYSPLARGDVFRSDYLKKMAIDKNCSVSEIVLAWLIKKKIVVIPKAASEDHIRENMGALMITLTDKEEVIIDALQSNQRTINPSWAEFD